METLIQNTLTGEDRLAALRLLADWELAQSASGRTQPANAGAIIAATETEGHRRLAALQQIAAVTVQEQS